MCFYIILISEVYIDIHLNVKTWLVSLKFISRGLTVPWLRPTPIASFKAYYFQKTMALALEATEKLLGMMLHKTNTVQYR